MSDNKMMKREGTDVATAAETRYRNVAPACDVYESADEYLIVAEMPGVPEGAVDLRMDRTKLAIQADRLLGDTSDTDGTFLRYTRAFQVPETIDSTKINAKLRNGVLSVHLPKAPQARVRQISVTAG